MTTVKEISDKVEKISQSEYMVSETISFICGECSKVISKKYSKPMKLSLCEKRIVQMVQSHYNKFHPKKPYYENLKEIYPRPGTYDGSNPANTEKRS